MKLTNRFAGREVRGRKPWSRGLCLALGWAVLPLAGWAEKPAPGEKPSAESSPAPAAARKSVKLPGIVIDLEEWCVDVASSVCLEEGALELVACTAGSKEHESIVAVEAKAIHIHTALLLLGAEAGSPAMRKLVDEDEQRWIDLPPRGGPVRVSFVFMSEEGKLVERPISDFIVAARAEKGDRKAKRLSNSTFLFAGSQLRGEGPGPRHYLSDRSGNVISLVTFGDELLCLPGVHGHANGALHWQVDATHLPAVGSKITLRLRPERKPAPGPAKSGEGAAGREPEPTKAGK